MDLNTESRKDDSIYWNLKDKISSLTIFHIPLPDMTTFSNLHFPISFRLSLSYIYITEALCSQVNLTVHVRFFSLHSHLILVLYFLYAGLGVGCGHWLCGDSALRKTEQLSISTNITAEFNHHRQHHHPWSNFWTKCWGVSTYSKIRGKRVGNRRRNWAARAVEITIQAPAVTARLNPPVPCHLRPAGA